MSSTILTLCEDCTNQEVIDYVNEMMIILGFDIKWVNLVILCVTTVQYSID